ncbi:DUF3888 domain-containing protein [Halalkalibacter alkaliphilus]|uniref:DUF3888 domain-containing protein n=1 Tax=Halalkalibacter alkaliphilus TaxID=2917993 RepID=A0A9X2I6K1_9BACI|nr:DUF3888 domain-containing protein [Halalkalibacter alkaliphilus]MCL7748673.1 DUF3888 domain-containing protein [Halalkalibacter alkaliphilus]
MIASLFILLIFICCQPVQAEEAEQELLKGAFIESMLDHITDAVNEHGTGRLWYRGNEEIIEIRRPDPHHITSYTVTIRVTTVEGAHNPPYAKETMNFKLPEMKLLDYRVEWVD